MVPTKTDNHWVGYRRFDCHSSSGVFSVRRRLRKAAVGLVVVVPYVWMGILTSLNTQEPHRIKNSVEAFFSGSCDGTADLALIYGPQRNGKTIPYPHTVTSVLFKIQADFRKAYIRQGCTRTSGPLPPADPRVARILAHPVQ
jgi:hypothetical protein